MLQCSKFQERFFLIVNKPDYLLIYRKSMLLAIIHLVKFTFEIIAKTRRVFEFGYAPLSSSAE